MTKKMAKYWGWGVLLGVLSTAGAAPQPREVSTLYEQIVARFKAEEYEQAKVLALKLVELTPEDGTAHYNLACAYSRLGETDLALKALGVSVDKGFVNIRHMENDPDLEPLWSLEGFRTILARRDELHRDRGERILAILQKRYGGDYLVEIDHGAKLVFATNTDRETLNDLKSDLTRQAGALWGELFDYKFERYITIIIPKPGAVRMGIAAGVYQPGSAQLVAKRIGMTLRHEFTHALHFADLEGRAQIHPIWVLEGLATLFETSRFEGGKLLPQPNERLLALQYYLARQQKNAAAKKKKDKFMLPSLADFLEYDQKKFLRRAHLSYAMCRYLMMYLYEKGKLRQWYQAYTAGFEAEPTGRAAWEKVFGQDLAAIETDWKAWVRSLPAPPRYVRTDQAYLGVSVTPAVEGLTVRAVVPGSGAARAGLQAGDLIVKADGRRLADGGELLQLVHEHNVGDAVPIRYRRDGEYHDTAVTFDKKPARIPSSPAGQGEAQPGDERKPPASEKKKKAA
jgi:hypothetical protein